MKIQDFISTNTSYIHMLTLKVIKDVACEIITVYNAVCYCCNNNRSEEKITLTIKHEKHGVYIITGHVGENLYFQMKCTAIIFNLKLLVCSVLDLGEDLTLI